MSISDDLEAAEGYLRRAVSKIGDKAGRAERMPSGLLWVGSIGDYKRAVSALLKVGALAKRIRALETPRAAGERDD